MESIKNRPPRMVHFIKTFHVMLTCNSEIIICSVSFLVCLERSWRRQRFVKNNSLNQVDPKSEIDDLFSRATEHRSVSHRKYYKGDNWYTFQSDRENHKLFSFNKETTNRPFHKDSIVFFLMSGFNESSRTSITLDSEYFIEKTLRVFQN